MKIKEIKNSIKEDLREKEVKSENPLKEMFVDYVGNKFQPSDGRVTIQMVATTLADEFPEFMILLAEQNYMQGYRQALDDVERVRNKELSEIQTADAFESAE